MALQDEREWTKEFPSLKDGKYFWLRNAPYQKEPHIKELVGDYSAYENIFAVGPETEYLGPLRPEDCEQLVRLRKLAAQCAIPYEALLMDSESRKWLAPEVWKSIKDAVTALREALNPELAERKQEGFK